MSRLLLQIFNVVAGLATSGLGIMQMIYGVQSPLYAAIGIPQNPILDSNLRFFGGMSLGIGLVLLWLIPTIERQTLLFRAVWLCAFIGGAGRLISWQVIGSPSVMLIGFSLLEVAGAPLLVYWQHRVAKSVVGPG